MVDRQARDGPANALREFTNGSISNKEYERKYPRSKTDHAVWEMYIQVWFFYSDVSEHTLTRKYALNDENLVFFERCISFLRSYFEFQWPRQKFRPGLLRLIGLSRLLKRWDDEEMSISDKEVWPYACISAHTSAIGKALAPTTLALHYRKLCLDSHISLW